MRWMAATKRFRFSLVRPGRLAGDSINGVSRQVGSELIVGLLINRFLLDDYTLTLTKIVGGPELLPSHCCEDRKMKAR